MKMTGLYSIVCLLALAACTEKNKPEQPVRGREDVQTVLPANGTLFVGNPRQLSAIDIMDSYSKEYCKSVCLDSLCGVIAIPVSVSGTLAGVQLSDNNSAVMLNGKCSFTCADGSYSIEGGTSSLTLSFDGKRLSADEKTWVLAVVPRGSFATGFRMKLMGSSGISGTVFSGTSACVVKPAQINIWEETACSTLDDKKALEAMPPSALCTDVKRVGDNYSVSFSNGDSYEFSSRVSGYVTRGSDGKWWVNGVRTPHASMGKPWYTVGPQGRWMSDGADTDEQAVPMPDMVPKTIEYVHLTCVVDNARTVDFCFTDGSTISFSKPQTSVMYVSKTTKQMDVYISRNGSDNYIDYPFYYRNKAYSAGSYPAFYDNWGIGALNLCTFDGSAFKTEAALFLRGEAEMAISVTDGADAVKSTYVGGTLHGFENIISEAGKRCISISVDGREVGESETFSLTKASKIVMKQSSELCQAYTTSDPFARAERTWTFENGNLSIHIQLTFIRQMQIAQAQFGMLCVLRHWEGDSTKPYLTRYGVRNSEPRLVYLLEDEWQKSGSALVSKKHSATRITEYGDKGLSFALCVDKATFKDKGGMFCGTNGNAYNKIYFDLTGSYQAAAGEMLEAEVHWEIDNQ